MTSCNKSLTIGLVCDDSLDRPDGVQQFTITLGEWLRNQGHDVHYITSRTDRKDLKNLHVLSKNLEVKFNGNRLKPPLPASPKAVKQLLSRYNFDVIHVQMPYSPFLAGQIIHYANKLDLHKIPASSELFRPAKTNFSVVDVPTGTSPTDKIGFNSSETSSDRDEVLRKSSKKTAVVGTFHILPDSKLVDICSKVLGLVTSPQLNKFAAFSSTSEPTRKFMLRTYSKNSQVIPNMTDVSKFSVEFKNNSDLVRVIFLGRLVERKGARYLAEAVNHMRKIGLPQNKYEVVIGGKGPLSQDLAEYINTNSLSSLIKLSGFVSEEDKPVFLANSDIVVLPSTGGESFGISVIEAMAATRGAVIVGNNPGYSSVIGAHKAQIVDPKDIDTFAHVLAKYIDNKNLRDDAQTWQKNDVKKYDINCVGRQFEVFYESALHKQIR